MNVIIRGMKMPKGCYDCPIHKRNGMEVLCPVCGETFSVADVNIFFYRWVSCPLIELPPHGRLIEAEPILKFIQDGLNSGEFGNDVIQVMTEIQYAPAVIPAEESE